MAGTNGHLIISDAPTTDGYLVPITQSGTINIPFSVPVKLVSVWNGTPDYLSVTVTTAPASTGNITFYLNPNAAQNIGSYSYAQILTISVTHLNLLNEAGGFVIANGFSG
jgi:hypothetical protein